ncbi:MAG: hypothetical protein JWM10_1652 [Myxococcaceae bacterium]|nr:hypothetical protein [Myxococcaceae bacterium]
MNKSCLLGVFASMAFSAVGCAAGPEMASVMPDGIVLETIAGGLAESSVDVAMPGAPIAQPALAESVGAAAAGAREMCPAMGSTAATMATAENLGACVRGALADADVGQYFVFTPEPGVSYALELTRPGDASFDLGVVAVDAAGVRSCAPFSSGLVATRVLSDGRVGALCAVVRSDSGAAQQFRITLNR